MKWYQIQTFKKRPLSFEGQVTLEVAYILLSLFSCLLKLRFNNKWQRRREMKIGYNLCFVLSELENDFTLDMI